MTSAEHRVDSVEEYRQLRGDAHQMNYDKAMTFIDNHIANFLAMSTFLTIASIDGDGNMDVSPKGDPAGFVKVIAEHTIAIPERARATGAPTLTPTSCRTRLSL